MNGLPDRQAAKGFTLVELQVALLLVALIAALLVGALRLASQTWTRVTEKQDRSEHRFLVSRMLRKHLSNMRFLRLRTDRNEIMTSFIGGTEQLYFVAPYPSFNNDGELYWWGIKSVWNDDRDLYQLVMDYFPYLPGEPVIIDGDGSVSYQDQLPTTLAIADNFQLFDAGYYSRDQEGVETWEDQWEPSTSNPLVVRFTLVVTDGDGNETELPEIAVAPRFASQQFYTDVRAQ